MIQLLKPGPKNKGPCPVDIHLRLPDHARRYLDSLGSGGNQEKIVSIILKASNKKEEKSQIEIKGELVRINREIKSLTERKRDLMEDLETNYGLTTKEYEAVTREIHEIVYPEDFEELK